MLRDNETRTTGLYDILLYINAGHELYEFKTRFGQPEDADRGDVKHMLTRFERFFGIKGDLIHRVDEFWFARFLKAYAAFF